MNLDAFLDKMTPDDLRRLQSKIGNKLGDSGTVIKEKTHDNEPVFEALSRVISSNGGKTIPWSVYKTTRGFADFQDKAEWLISFVAKNFRPKTKIESSYCYLLVIRLLVGWMDRRGIPVTFKSCINCLPRIPSLVEESFPGYLQAGILPNLVAHAKA